VTTPPGGKPTPPPNARVRRPPSARLRWRVLAQLEKRIEKPIALLGLVWLVLFVIEVTRGLSPLLSTLSVAIWVIFAGDFVVRLLIAPHRWQYLRRNWLAAISLVVPALRAVRLLAVFRVIRFARGARLLRVVASLNRSMGALGSTLRRRGISYVALLTVAVILGGAAGMYALEPHDPNGAAGFASYGDALWWTSMIVTTLGSAYWPRTPEGRTLALLLSLFAIGVFGYITATLASFFVDRDAASPSTDVASAQDIRTLRLEIQKLRETIEKTTRNEGRAAP
jgi:voltage-gated potassium channel